jgi:hypothetical protein
MFNYLTIFLAICISFIIFQHVYLWDKIKIHFSEQEPSNLELYRNLGDLNYFMTDRTLYSKVYDLPVEVYEYGIFESDVPELLERLEGSIFVNGSTERYIKWYHYYFYIYKKKFGWIYRRNQKVFPEEDFLPLSFKRPKEAKAFCDIIVKQNSAKTYEKLHFSLNYVSKNLFDSAKKLIS